ncbi:MAG: hypothetical protein HC825_06690, partial [Oscillatoriales cyanobacterium RM1_1_9]|nr:hypothetical protein [Oscillatoriales cyanobacterium RM1_1_9]
KNRIFRPTQIYTGSHEEPYIPIERRAVSLERVRVDSLEQHLERNGK